MKMISDSCRWILVLVFLSVVALGQAAPAAEEWQSWSRISLEGPLCDLWRISLDEEFRSQVGGGGLFFHRSDAGVNYRAASWVRLGAYYWHDYHRKGDAWMEERRLHGHTTLRWTLWTLPMRHRSRFEWRFPDGASSHWRYRDMIRIGLPPGWLPFGMSGYFGNELFIDLRDGSYHQNRMDIGFTARVKGRFHIDFYFMLRSDRVSSDSSWRHTPLFGQKLKFVF